jgi:hypothetical protein
MHGIKTMGMYPQRFGPRFEASPEETPPTRECTKDMKE